MTTQSKFLRVLSCVIGSAFLCWASVVNAVPFSSDLSISGTVNYDTDFAAAELSGGAQSGTLRVTQGGVNSSSTFNNTSVTGSNPLSATLSNIGDGLGFTGRASASGANGASTFGIGIDLGLNLTNNSATNGYVLTFNVDFNHSVNSAGADAYATSNFYVRNKVGSGDVFFTDLFTDTVNGNKVQGVATPEFGGMLTDSGLASFMLTLMPGQSIVFDPSLYELSWTLRGGAFTQDASASAFLDAFVSIASVDRLGGPNPNPVPAPATWLLVLAGVAALRWNRGFR